MLENISLSHPTSEIISAAVPRCLDSELQVHSELRVRSRVEGKAQALACARASAQFALESARSRTPRGGGVRVRNAQCDAHRALSVSPLRRLDRIAYDTTCANRAVITFAAGVGVAVVAITTVTSTVTSTITITTTTVTTTPSPLRYISWKSTSSRPKSDRNCNHDHNNHNDRDNVGTHI